MSDSSPFAPDLPELRLLAQLGGVKPSAIAAALNNPEHFSEHISAAEVSRFLNGVRRVFALWSRIEAILDVELNRTLNAKRR